VLQVLADTLSRTLPVLLKSSLTGHDHILCHETLSKSGKGLDSQVSQLTEELIG
jgi:hypothetical protein